jgi:hypothetical protein
LVLKLIKAIVYSNVWIALGAVSFGASTYLIVRLPIDYSYLSLVFFATFFAYNFQRLVRLHTLSKPLSERQVWLVQHQKSMRLVTLLSFFAMVLFSFYALEFSHLWLLLPSLMLVLLYATFFVNSKKGLRDLPMLKIFLIASVWAYVLGIFPLLKMDNYNNWHWIFFDKFFFIMALAIPFDIRDLKVDSADKKTLPQVLGTNGSKFLASVFLATSFAIQFLAFQSTFNFFQPFYFVMVLALIFFANPNRKELYFSGLMDGVLVLYLVTFI